MRDDFDDDFAAPLHPGITEENPLADAIAAWLRARCGKATSSNMHKARAFKRATKDKPAESTAERIKYMMEIVAERMTDQSVRHFVSPAMQWGLDHEDDARALYEIRTGEVVDHEPYRFRDHPSIPFCGASDDGLVGHDGMVEIKCPTSPVYVAWRRTGGVPKDHCDQIILELACHKRVWCDFVAYEPRVKDRRLQMMIVRYAPTPEEFAALERDARTFLDEVDALFLAVTHG